MGPWMNWSGGFTTIGSGAGSTILLTEETVSLTEGTAALTEETTWVADEARMFGMLALPSRSNGEAVRWATEWERQMEHRFSWKQRSQRAETDVSFWDS